MCLSHTLSEIEHQKRELRKVRVFEVQVCRTCGHFQKDTDFWVSGIDAGLVEKKNK